MSDVSIVKLTISQAAKLFGVDKKTLMRWDSSGELKANREPITNTRYYNSEEIKWQAYWYRLRVNHKNHNRKLTSIRKQADKFLAIIPLSEHQNSKVHNLEEMNAAYKALRKWEAEHREIMSQYNNLPNGFRHTVDAP
jgi:DNA-binding transcriptional MerR regulator